MVDQARTSTGEEREKGVEEASRVSGCWSVRLSPYPVPGHRSLPRLVTALLLTDFLGEGVRMKV